ncbi:MAG: hypothetical protein IPJ17_19395 [Holophagales bacterium]|nr:MAG: hypothetical protein IPJ17_19395 [Holophagales bacterium]
MRLPHLFAVDEEPQAFAPLWAAAAAAGLRLGWLELGEPDPVSARLEAAAEAGAMRAVRAGNRRVATVKPMRGAPVLRDLLREHFAGCAGVLICGSDLSPRLAPCGESWSLRSSAASAAREVSADGFVALLRRPRPES